MLEYCPMVGRWLPKDQRESITQRWKRQSFFSMGHNISGVARHGRLLIPNTVVNTFIHHINTSVVLVNVAFNVNNVSPIEP